MRSSRMRFVIIEDNDFIAGDMAVGLRFASPDSVVLRLRHRSEIFSLPRDLNRTTVFVTGDPLTEIDASGLAEFARQTKAEIVVREGIDSNAAVEARGFHSLSAPFTDAALLAVAEEFVTARVA